MAVTMLIPFIGSLLGTKHHQSAWLAPLSTKLLYLRIWTAVQHGFGRHFAVLKVDSMVEWFKYLYAFEFLYTLSMAVIKYSM